MNIQPMSLFGHEFLKFYISLKYSLTTADFVLGKNTEENDIS
jgi:hypothetical protein